jgi:hypothetical protein
MIDYEYLVDSAMRVLIKDILKGIEKHGITGGHYFHITFVTKYDGLLLPSHIVDKYPHEITIALQNQFRNLNVYEDTFAVDLSFGGKETRIVVPFCAITAFADPSVDFTLRMIPDNMGMVGKSKFHEMISSGTYKCEDEDKEENNIINFADIKDKLK